MNTATEQTPLRAEQLHNDILRHLDREHGKQELRTQPYRRWELFSKGVMYLCLGIAALIYADNANARDIAYMPNKAGGEIILTDVTSEACPAGTLIILSRTREGDTLFGCWAYERPYVYVKWVDGEFSMFKLAEFRLSDKPVEKQAKRGLGT
jgi:hypothetical protein